MQSTVFIIELNQRYDKPIEVAEDFESMSGESLHQCEQYKEKKKTAMDLTIKYENHRRGEKSMDRYCRLSACLISLIKKFEKNAGIHSARLLNAYRDLRNLRNAL